MEFIQFFFEKVKQEGKQNHLKMPPMTLLASGAGEPDYRILEEVPGQGGGGNQGDHQGWNVQHLKLIDKSVNKLFLVDEEECVPAHARLGWPLVQRRLGQFQPADSVC